MGDLGRSIIIVGVVLVVIGFLVTAMGKIPGMGKLPGDIMIKRENYSFYFPIVSCIVISIILSIIMNFLNRK